MKRWLYLLLLPLVLLSCKSLEPLTENYVATNKWGEKELKRIQFYLSHDLVLQRKFVSGSTQIASGSIKTVDGEQVEEIVIPKGTPGVLEYYPNDKKGRVGISFEEGGKERYLMFAPNGQRGGRYYLLASSWNNGIGKVNYDGKEYYTSRSGNIAFLMVNMKKIRKLELNKRIAKGRKIE